MSDLRSLRKILLQPMKTEIQPHPNTDPTKKKPKSLIGISFGMRGYYPVQYTNDEIKEPIQTGFSCKTYADAEIAAIEWSEADGIPVDFVTEKQ